MIDENTYDGVRDAVEDYCVAFDMGKHRSIDPVPHFIFDLSTIIVTPTNEKKS